ncbi:hypothetical protein FB567DRAFT_122477 [Paraphoma chrysanthemicola]|uniref:Uncharacterized protein n=1 Tax=Paraphoma chrysanthemicola TaxID=798071 RepID=A0A8K0R1D5_9PLEO|nr:hypothetical protein FB567DRAFT_122477 [Paraphoma chrysanthemicola]
MTASQSLNLQDKENSKFIILWLYHDWTRYYPGELVETHDTQSISKDLLSSDRMNFLPGLEQLTQTEVRSMQLTRSVAGEPPNGEDLLEAALRALHNPTSLSQQVRPQQQNISGLQVPAQEQQTHEGIYNAHPSHQALPVGQRNTIEVDHQMQDQHSSLGMHQHEVRLMEYHNERQERLESPDQSQHMPDANRNVSRALHDEQQLQVARLRAQREGKHRQHAIANNRFEGLGASGSSRKLDWKAMKRGVKGHIHRLGKRIAEVTEPQHDKVGVDGTHPSMSSASKVSSVNRGRPLPKNKHGLPEMAPAQLVSDAANEEVKSDTVNTPNDYGTTSHTRSLRQFFSIRSRRRHPCPVSESHVDPNADISSNDHDHHPETGPGLNDPDVPQIGITIPRDGEDRHHTDTVERRHPGDIARHESWSPLD